MSQSTSYNPTRESALPGARIVERIRRLIVAAALAAFGYAFLTAASKGYCPGGVTAEGAFIDSVGDLADAAPSCISLTLRPSVLVFLAIALIVFVALTRVLRRATDEDAAVRSLDRAARGVVILAAASVVVSQTWFAMIPVSDWDGTGTFIYPFPFGSVDLVIAPMTVS